MPFTRLCIVGLKSLGQGPPPSFANLTFPSNGQTLLEGETLIAGTIFAPNGISQGPVLRHQNLNLRSWDEVRLNITGQDNFFDYIFEWPDAILQAGEVVLTLTATDNLGLSTSVSAAVTVTPNQAILALDTQLDTISKQRGTELSGLYADMGMFLSRCQAFSFDSALASIWAGMVAQTSAAGLSQANPWKPHILSARNSVAGLNAPDEVAAKIQANTLSFLDGFYDRAETQNNNYLTWIPAPNKDLPLLQRSITAHHELAIVSSINGDLGEFQMARGPRELFSLAINLGTTPPLVEGSAYGIPLTAAQKLHPVLATRPVIDGIYMVTAFNLLQNTADKGGIQMKRLMNSIRRIATPSTGLRKWTMAAGKGAMALAGLATCLAAQ